MKDMAITDQLLNVDQQPATRPVPMYRSSSITQKIAPLLAEVVRALFSKIQAQTLKSMHESVCHFIYTVYIYN